jgi:hypothetical protein
MRLLCRKFFMAGFRIYVEGSDEPYLCEDLGQEIILGKRFQDLWVMHSPLNKEADFLGGIMSFLLEIKDDRVKYDPQRLIPFGSSQKNQLLSPERRNRPSARQLPR